MKLLFENWRKYLKEANESIDHSEASHLQTVDRALGHFVTSVNELIQRVQNEEDFNEEDFIDKLWTLYRRSKITSHQLGNFLNDLMDGHDLPKHIDDAILGFAMEFTGPTPEGRSHEKIPAIVTFDFDDTLSLSHWDDDKGFVYDGPYQEMMDLLMNYHKEGSKIYIVTSRHKEMQDEDGNWFTFNPKVNPSKRYIKDYQMPVWEFVKKNGLPIQDVIFTNGQLKAEAEDGLIELGSDVHHDDDPEEIHAAQQAGIKTTISDPYPEERQEKWEAASPERDAAANEMKARIAAHQQRQSEK